MGPRSRATLLAGLLGASIGVTGPAFAQAGAGCGDIQKHLEQRKSIADSLQAGGKKKMDAKIACAGFNRLVTNGATIVKWTDANKDWCQVPDSFVEGIKADHEKAQQIRTKACGVAAKIEQMEKQAKSGAANGLLGGGGLTGPTAMPQGAL
jgi:hypothetical protein